MEQAVPYWSNRCREQCHAADLQLGRASCVYRRRRDDEVFVVLEGELSFLTATGWVPVPQGTVVYAPRGAPHTFRNVGSVPSRHLVLTLPSGFDEFYVRCAELFAADRPPDPQQLRTVAAEFGYEFLAPGLLDPASGHRPNQGTA